MLRRTLASLVLISTSCSDDGSGGQDTDGGTGSQTTSGPSSSATSPATSMGETTSSDLPVTADAHQGALATGPDAYVVRLSPDLDTLVYATYLGGAPHDTGRGAVLGDDCTAVLVGAADGQGFPVVDPWQADFAGGGAEFGNGDNIMAKLELAP